MANLNKEQQFRVIVLDAYGGDDKFDKINYTMNRIRNTFIEDVTDFNKMKVETQYQICVATYLISMNSKRSVMKEISIGNKQLDTEIVKYDPERGFIEPTYVQVRTASGEVKFIESL